MTADRAARLSRRLAFAANRAAVGPLAVEGLLDLCGAQGAIAWLSERAEAREAAGRLTTTPPIISCAGELVMGAPVDEIAAALAEEALEEWLMAHGARSARVTDASRSVRLAVAWTGTAPVAAPSSLELMAGHVSSVLERLDTDLLLATTRTSLRDYEREIAQTRRVRAIGEMASGIVHDFNNCLTTILGFTELALGPLEQKDARFTDLATIRTAALDAAALVRRLQTLSRPERGADEREVVDPRDIVEAMPRLANPRWSRQAQCEGVTFDIVVETQPTRPVYVAVAEIRELLLNLIFNSVDAMPNGGRIVIATREVDSEVEISVTDEGIGMTPDVLDRVFEPFFSTKGDRGYGLGLAVCRSIVERHGGKLSARSTAGQGSTFTLRLSAAPSELLAPLAGAAAVHPVDSAHRRVLLVDDQHEVRESVGEMLRALGHEVLVSEEGQAALAVAMRQPVDLVLTDLGMPNMNGLEVARRLRTVVPGTPVVLLTGWGLEDNQVPENVTCVLSKPITMKVLADALATSTGRAAQSRRIQCS